jgi:SAM-dependent methyltransferase
MTRGDTDWNDEWARLSDRGEAVHDAAFWDRRAREFRGGDEASPYVRGFIDAMQARPGESVLDVGCGSGALALPLARAGHPVTAVDFSAGMLAALRRRLDEEGVHGVRTVQAGWDDDWAAAGIEPAGLAIASRSLDVADLRAALRKLDAFACRRVCLTLPADGLFYPSLLAHEAVGRPLTPHGDHRLALQGLAELGVESEVGILEHGSVSHYDSREQALASLRRVVAPADEQEERALDRYVTAHVVETTTDDGRRLWTQEPVISVRWALLAWDKR